ncbi:MAG: hypothetical protein GX172_03670 [Clostridiales bacterium]|nr:hypothetical protein [Clostridiales bacterium]HOB37347.1 hypothetical protein [Candidatus Avimonas sp.]HQD38836.1 hypothetical protein [Candidatus Avimonas sp.]
MKNQRSDFSPTGYIKEKDTKLPFGQPIIMSADAFLVILMNRTKIISSGNIKTIKILVHDVAF